MREEGGGGREIEEVRKMDLGEDHREREREGGRDRERERSKACMHVVLIVAW